MKEVWGSGGYRIINAGRGLRRGLCPSPEKCYLGD